MRYLLMILFFGPWMVWGQGEWLLPDSLGLHEEYGHSVAMGDGYAFVGSPFRYDKRGAVLIYRKIGNDWVFDSEILASDGVAGDWFGYRMAVDGANLVIGAPFDADLGSDSGAAYVFRKEGDEWIEKEKLTASDGDQYDVFGSDVAIQENTIVVSAVGSNQCGLLCGAAYIFEKNGDEWVETGSLFPPNGEDWMRFGLSVAVVDNIVIIGSANTGTVGLAYVYEKNMGFWQISKELHASDETIYASLFSHTLAVWGSCLAVGAPQRREDSKIAIGAVYIFEHTSDGWIEVQKLQKTMPSMTIDGYQFGSSIAMWSGNLAIAANQREVLPNVRARDVYYYHLDGNVWQEEQKISFAPAEGDEGSLGLSVAIDTEGLLVGVPYSDTLSHNSGAAHIFNLSDLVAIESLAQKEIDLRFSPNPAIDFIQISWTDAIISSLSIEISDMTGRVLKSVSKLRPQEAIDVSFLPQGVYVLTLYQDGQLLKTEKLTILR